MMRVAVIAAAFFAVAFGFADITNDCKATTRCREIAETCNSTWFCNTETSYCDSADTEKCVAFGKVGEDCEEGTMPCEDTLYCGGDKTCAEYGDEEDFCNITVRCMPTLQCKENKCKPYDAVDPCTVVAIGEDCDNTEKCCDPEEGRCTGGECEAWMWEGEDCSSSKPCYSGSSMLDALMCGDAGKCIKPYSQAKDADCDKDSECMYTLACISGKCSALPDTAGDECEKTSDCDDGTNCACKEYGTKATCVGVNSGLSACSDEVSAFLDCGDIAKADDCEDEIHCVVKCFLEASYNKEMDDYENCGNGAGAADGITCEADGDGSGSPASVLSAVLVPVALLVKLALF